jgi:hypothetical protein
MGSQIYRGETVYDHTNFGSLIGNGRVVNAGGEDRLLSRIPEPPGHDRRVYSRPFSESGIKLKPRSEWSAEIKAQEQQKRRISDFQFWPALNQNGTPQCWSNGVAGAAATCRVIMGLPYVQLSPGSVATPISGGNQGGFEGDAVQYGTEHGWAPSVLWPEHSCDRSLNSDPKVIESRPKFMLLEVFDLGDDFDALGTALLENLPCLAAYPDWSHVTEICDLLEIEKDSYGSRGKNSWGNDWGGKNDLGSGGYFTFREKSGPHCRPSGIFALRQITAHPGTEYLNAA